MAINEFKSEKGTQDGETVEEKGNKSHLMAEAAVQMQKQSAEGLMSLLRIAGKAFSYLTSYESRLAIDTVERMSPRHKRSSWVLSLMAKAHFELADYKEAARYFFVFQFFFLPF